MIRQHWPYPHIGRRGLFLCLFGLAWITVGVSVLQIPPTDTTLYSGWPVWPRAIAWFLSGIIAIIFAFVPPRASDAPGFVVLLIMPLMRFFLSLVAWAQWILPDGDPDNGYRFGWVTSIFYGLFIGVILIVAGWRENPRLNQWT